jgi:hypothetical protein
MELLPILSILWRRRWLVIVGLVGSLAVAYLLQSTPKLGPGTAAAQVMLDTPRSDLASSEEDDTTNLAPRAALVAHTVATDQVRDRLARAVGLPPERLAVIDASFRYPVAPTTLPQAASEAALSAPEPYLLQTRFDGITPIIWLEARAPDPADAARLVDAAVKDLSTTYVATGKGSAYKPFTIERVSDTRVHQLITGRARMTAVVAGGMLFVLWCFCLIAHTSFAAWLRERSGRVAAPEPWAERT